MPTPTELDLVSSILGTTVSFERRLNGGQSATTDVLLDSNGGRLALRRHGRWSIGFDDGIAAREEAVLRTVGRAGIPVPAVRWSGQLGPTTATITDHVEGTPIIMPDDPIRWAAQLAGTLAAIHAVDVGPDLATLLRSAPPSPVDLEPAPDLRAHRYGEALLAKRTELASSMAVDTSLVHGDYWPGNLLWHKDEIAAVLDWEAAVLGDPASDVAYCVAEMRYLGLNTAATHFVAAYRSLTGSALTSLTYWMVTALCRAVPELDSYLDGWRPLGYEPETSVVRGRLDDLIVEALADSWEA